MTTASQGTAARPAPRRSPPMPWLRPGIFIGALAPLVSVVWHAYDGSLSANPIAEAENELGLTALIMLLSALACTPARKAFGWTWPLRNRRMLGLFAFFYASMHFLLYLTLDLGLDPGAVLGDIAKRPFITVGFTALVLMAPLALTSTTGWVKRLGFMRWQNLHRVVYVAGALAVVHFIWRVKIDVSQPLTYAAVLGVLLGARIAVWLMQRSKAARS